MISLRVVNGSTTTPACTALGQAGGDQSQADNNGDVHYTAGCPRNDLRQRDTRPL